MKRASTGVTDEVICGEFSDPPDSVKTPGFVRALTWNIERGVRFDAILAFLRKCEADLILLQETDLNARRSAYRDVAHELAQSLCLNYVFGLQFQELSSPHGIKPAYQGLATLSPWPLSNGRVIRFRKQSKFWLPRTYIPQMEIFQRRLGGENRSRLRGGHRLTQTGRLEPPSGKPWQRRAEDRAIEGDAGGYAAIQRQSALSHRWRFQSGRV